VTSLRDSFQFISAFPGLPPPGFHIPPLWGWIRNVGIALLFWSAAAPGFDIPPPSEAVVVLSGPAHFAEKLFDRASSYPVPTCGWADSVDIVLLLAVAVLVTLCSSRQ
jgi:hypothetical protein